MEATKEFLIKIADDAFIIGHRNSEWTGLGPTLEEDISFSSMSQDKIGHAIAIYNILHEEFGMSEPDELAFQRKADSFLCCHLVEVFSRDYAFCLARHFYHDRAEALRYAMLESSSLESLSKLALKFKGEIKYHTLHADTWIKQLAGSAQESKARIQEALEKAYPLALGIFEEGPFEDKLRSSGVFEGEAVLREKWTSAITEFLVDAGIDTAFMDASEANAGGRSGSHSEDLKKLLTEMTEVSATDKNANW